MNQSKATLLNDYRAYAAKLAGSNAEALCRLDVVVAAARRVMASVADCRSDEDALNLFAGGRLLGMTGNEREALDAMIHLWELVRPETNNNRGQEPQKETEMEGMQVPRYGTMADRIEKDFTYFPPKDGQPERYERIRNFAKQLALTVDECCPDTRERSVALTKLNEVVMWANAGIARNE